ncbi:hypothetical protein QQ045_001677 [Rhodiola kirilowii]
MLDTDGEYGGKSKRPFRFEAMWLEHPEFSKVIRNVWNTSSGHRDSWAEILKLCQEKLKVWNFSTFGNVQGRVKGLKNRLEVIKTLVRTDDVVEEEGRLSEELDQWLLREEVLWLQRSQISWLKFGDRNTKFLHACANQRRKKNWINELRDNRGNRFSDKNKLTSMATDYFNEIFRPSYTDDVVDWSRQLVCLQPVISEEMNRGLLEDISEEEVRRAVFNMSPLKAPGVDGFPALFYQKNWGNIRGYVMVYVRELWMNGVLEDRLNKTLIVLIPKKKDADRMEDLRPISLCTGILDRVISASQSAFIKGRIITDNFIVAHEISHFLKRCRSQKEFFASIKVDMSKAYDQVEWSFLEQVMERMGFAEKWINRVMLCVWTVTYQVKINDQTSRSITPGRGLRQGDPLSPYLFLLVSELLSAKMSAAVDRKTLSGIQLGHGGPTISHLFFADDSIFFMRASREEAAEFREILSQYEMVSGQRINMEKSEVVFSRNTPTDVRQDVGSLLRIGQVDSHSKYLGLPLIVGQRKTETFHCITEKIWRKIGDWKGKLLSMAGKEVLIKAVVQSIPVYMMSVYYFPQKNLDDIAKLIGQFWWNKDGQKWISWLSREVLYRKKEGGGIGFKDLRIFNEAILMKICWRMLTQPQLLVSKVLKARYYQNIDLSYASLGGRPSHIWRGVMKNIQLFWSGLEWNENSNGVVWKMASNGDFFVKIAYGLISNNRISVQQGLGEQSFGGFKKRFWNNIWKSTVPNKLIIFCWRLYHGALPDVVRLIKRGVGVDPRCKICGLVGETAEHVVMSCWWVKALQISLEMDTTLEARDSETIRDWLWSEFMGLGTAVLGQDGGVLRVQADIMKRSSCVSEGEGLAMFGGMRLASSMGLNRVCFETDSTEVYKAVCLGWGAAGWCDSWIVEATHLLESHEEQSTGLIGREQNVLADRLAFKARQEDWRWSETLSVPRWVADFV